ncbi:MAG: DUF1259 domain-containing protein [Gemmatimonadales bacterium]
MGYARIRLAVAAAALIAPPIMGQSAAVPAPWDAVGKVLGATAQANAGSYRYGFPRTDLTVRVGDVTVAPAIALGSWAAFAVGNADTMVMGDLALTADEVPGVLARLREGGFRVTAIHNHLIGEVPRIVFVHYEGHGAPLPLATSIRRAVEGTATPLPVKPSPIEPVTIDTALIFGELGLQGRANGAIAQAGVNLLLDPVTMDGGVIPTPLGLMSPINFQAVSPSRVVATGDFAIMGDKVERLLTALARAGIQPTAIHSHLIKESPTLYFVHFWADGPPRVVAHGLREALDAAR